MVLPPFPPPPPFKPPFLSRPPFLRDEEREEIEERFTREERKTTQDKIKEVSHEMEEEEFRSRMKASGYNGELIEMGIKVAKNHLKSPEEAFQVGENYIREMSR